VSLARWWVCARSFAPWQGIKIKLRPHGFTGFKLEELTPNKTRRAQCGRLSRNSFHAQSAMLFSLC
jgi:hypothetical protein